MKLLLSLVILSVLLSGSVFCQYLPGDQFYWTLDGRDPFYSSNYAVMGDSGICRVQILVSSPTTVKTRAFRPSTGAWGVLDSAKISIGVLPIQLLFFVAAEESGSVLLSWRTLTETNNYGFDIERNGTFLFDSFVPGHGTTLVPHDYSYSDHIPFGREVRYRLRQIDLDGEQWISQYIILRFLPRKRGVSGQ